MGVLSQLHLQLHLDTATHRFVLGTASLRGECALLPRLLNKLTQEILKSEVEGEMKPFGCVSRRVARETLAVTLRFIPGIIS